MLLGKNPVVRGQKYVPRVLNPPQFLYPNSHQGGFGLLKKGISKDRKPVVIKRKKQLKSLRSDAPETPEDNQFMAFDLPKPEGDEGQEKENVEEEAVEQVFEEQEAPGAEAEVETVEDVNDGGEEATKDIVEETFL